HHQDRGRAAPARAPRAHGAAGGLPGRAGRHRPPVRERPRAAGGVLMAVITAETVREEVQTWIAENWDPAITVAEWWERLAMSGHAAPPPPAGGVRHGRNPGPRHGRNE